MTLLEQKLAAFSQGECSLDELLAGVDDFAWSADEEVEHFLQVVRSSGTSGALSADVLAAIEDRLKRVGPRIEPPAGDPSAMIGSREEGAREDLVSDQDPGGGGRTDRTQVQVRGDVDVGEVINKRYVLEEKLAKGGMGTVFKALDRRRREVRDPQPYVALKVVSGSFRDHPDAFIALAREAKKAQRMSHPNIVRVHDFDRDGDTIYMTMEYLSGKPLNDISKRPGFSGLSVNQVLEIIKPVGDALAFAHKSGIVHSDLKPGNIFLTDDERIKVIDFGIARAIQSMDRPEGEQTAFDVSSLHAMTLAYASPEMIEGEDPDQRDDIYSLACVTYELLTGRRPFGRLSGQEAQAQDRRPRKPEGLNRRQWAGLRQGMAFEREERTATVEEFVTDLSSSESIPKRNLVITGAIAGVVLVAGIGAYLFWETQMANVPPETANDSAITQAPEAVVIDVLANDSDRDGDELRVTAVSRPAAGTAKVNADNTVTYAPQPDFSGTDSFGYVVEDVAGESASGEVRVTVLPAPEIVAPLPPAPTPAAPAPKPTVSVPAPIAPAPEPISPEPKPTAPPVAPPALVAAPDVDEIDRILGQVPCSALATTIRGRDVTVFGYVVRAADVNTIARAVGGVPGVQGVRTSIGQIESRYCGLLDFFRPYVEANQRNDLDLSISPTASKSVWSEDEPLTLTIQGPPFGSFIYVDYYMLNGYVVHMTPSPQVKKNRLAANATKILGKGDGSGIWSVAPPFGTEMIIVLATPSPLFAQQRPEIEPEQEYLAAMQKALASASRSPSGGEIAADWLFVTTGPKR